MEQSITRAFEPSANYAHHIDGRISLASRWRDMLEPLHECRMSGKYRLAMSVDDGWDFQRDTDFAMDVLLPDTVDLLTSDRTPTTKTLGRIPWIDTVRPGNYACKATKFDRDGKIISTRLKVGTAWSHKGGLKKRRATQEVGCFASLRAAADGSIFHTFINSAVDGEYVILEWHTLAVGESFRRNDDEDEYLSARWYQVEALLSAALGAPTTSMENTKYLELLWWPFGYAALRPEGWCDWISMDSHNAIQDVWVNRSGITEEQAQAMLKAQRAIIGKTYYDGHKGSFLCTDADCPRSKSDNGLSTQKALRLHLEYHMKTDALRKCFDPRCSFQASPANVKIHQSRHIDGTFPCGACGLLLGMAWCASDHAVSECIVEGAEELHEAHVARVRALQTLHCIDAKCGREFRNTPTGIRLRESHIEVHVNGENTCTDCGMRFSSTLGRPFQHVGDTGNPWTTGPFCQGRSKDDPPLPCKAPLCTRVFQNTHAGRTQLASHEYSHEVGTFLCADCGLPFESATSRYYHASECLTPAPPIVDESKPAPMMPCKKAPLCTQTFYITDEARRDSHERGHDTGKSVCTNEDCQLRFYNSSGRKTHMSDFCLYRNTMEPEPEVEPETEPKDDARAARAMKRQKMMDDEASM